MKTYIYQDEKSHKFWAVEQQGNELHISWGKVGTNGQSQVRSFADAAAAEKAELKLIAEKVKKGYVEHAAATELQMTNETLQNDSVPSELYSETFFSPVKTSADSMPWLQENSPIILDEPYRSKAFSSRNFPGEKISIVYGPDSFLEFIWQQNTCPTEFKTILGYFDVNACNVEWKNALNETIIRAEQGIEEGSLLSDVFLIIACPVFRISLKQEILLDYIVQHKGLEYAVDIILALMQIQIDIEDRGIDADLIFHFSHSITQQRFEYGISPLEFQLRKHLSHAEEKTWLCCTNKLIEALSGIAPRRQPIIALLLLEKPEITNQIALNLSHLDFPELEWLKIFVTDPQAISLLEKFNHWKLFESYSFGESCIATLLQEQGISGLSRLSAWANDYRVHDALLQINHPYSLELVIHKTDRIHQLESLIQKFPESMLAALCAIVCQNSHPLYETLIQGIALSNMPVVRRTWPYLTPTAQEALTGCLHQRGLNLEIDPTVPDWQPHTNHILALLSQEKCSYYDDDPLIYSKDHPETALSALTQSCLKGKNSSFLKQLSQLILTHGQAVQNFLEWCSETQKQFIYNHFPQLITKSEVAKPNEIPDILVSPPWLIKKNISLPVLKLDILRLSPVVNTTPALQTTCTVSTVEILEHLGLRYAHGNNVKKYFPEEIVNAWNKGDYRDVIKKHRYNLINLSALIHLPEDKAIKIWNIVMKDYFLYQTGAEDVISHFGISTLPALLSCSGHAGAKEILPLITNIGATELAVMVSNAFSQLKTFKSLASDWLLSFPQHAIAGLLPTALGKPGKTQNDAQLSLRLLIDNGYSETVLGIAQMYKQAEVMVAVKQLLSIDPLNNIPNKINPLPTWCQPNQWRKPVLKNNGKILPVQAIQHLCTMLSFPREANIYPGITQVAEACTPQSLADFAWDLFLSWESASGSAKDNWAFTALGILGNDDTARKLTPLIRAWPGESQHTRATVGLDILAAIGSDIALMQLNGIAQKLKFKALQDQARIKIAQIAESRELTVAEMEDRLAPDLGLDDNGSLLLDFGPRQFTVSFDEALKPFVRDASGSRLKDLPKPNKSDDAPLATEAVNRYKLLKKDVRTVAAQQISRLEAAMCQRRRWTAEQFRLFLVEHPLVRHITQRLMWGVYDADNQLVTCFRVAEDGSFSDGQDNPLTLPQDCIGIPHVLEILAPQAAEFAQQFSDYELLPPFRQLDRTCSQLSDSEKSSNDLQRWAGRKAASGRVAGLMNKGWQRGDVLDAGGYYSFYKPVDDGYIELSVTPGFSVGLPVTVISDTQAIDHIQLYKQTSRKSVYPFSALDDITASELINDIESLFD
ncbi:WGR and DUF4132 domain-containing protein [Escherichia coli]|nr:WGR and DUF4132 domain-containing protein [Escherichia coli]